MAKIKNLSFVKMTGGGNDFVVFDNRKNLPLDYSTLAASICRRKFAVGADGILALESTPQADFRMVYYNSDGSRAEMCGNGARCIARFAYLHKAAGEEMKFLTDAGMLEAQILPVGVKLKMSAPQNFRDDFAIKVDDEREFHLSSLNTGVPHVVLGVSDIEKVDVQDLGAKIRFHKEFSPAGTNVNFVFHKGGNDLIVRTYERGVEGETLACGTGVVASALLSAAKGYVSSPVSALTRGGEILKVHFTQVGPGEFRDVYLEGPADVCFKGEYELNGI